MEFYGKRVKSYEIKSSIDIHSAMDVEIAKILIKNRNLIKNFLKVNLHLKYLPKKNF